MSCYDLHVCREIKFQIETGVALAVQNGVDIIAHTTSGNMWSDELIAKMIANKISLKSTFKLYDFLAKQHTYTAVSRTREKEDW